MHVQLPLFASTKWLVATAVALVLSSCTVLPNQGPLSADIEQESVGDDYLLISVDAAVSRTLARYSGRGFDPGTFPRGATKPSNEVGIGDVLSVQILEAGNSGLFSQGPIGSSGNTVFPIVIVDINGNISLPYVGELKAAGNSPQAIQNSIVTSLQGKAIEPQALVVLKSSANNSVTVAGDLFRPGKYELSFRGDRLSDAIAFSGGSKFPAHETTVTVIRHGNKGSLRLNEVLENPNNNISLQRNDLVVLTRDPKRYTLIGAVPKAGAFPFLSSQVSVLEALAGAGGLLDQKADPKGVFVFRYEKRSVLKKLGHASVGKYPADSRGVPTIYQFDFQSAKSHFYAQSFLLENKDAIYVSNADAVQLTKLLQLIDLASNPL
jgi:polysaccharide biosynthesis/export protein